MSAAGWLSVVCCLPAEGEGRQQRTKEWLCAAAGATTHNLHKHVILPLSKMVLQLEVRRDGAASIMMPPQV